MGQGILLSSCWGENQDVGSRKLESLPFAAPLWGSVSPLDIPVRGKPTGAICKCQRKAITEGTADICASGDPGRLPRGGVGFRHDELSGRGEE